MWSRAGAARHHTTAVVAAARRRTIAVTGASDDTATNATRTSTAAHRLVVSMVPCAGAAPRLSAVTTDAAGVVARGGMSGLVTSPVTAVVVTRHARRHNAAPIAVVHLRTSVNVSVSAVTDPAV